MENDDKVICTALTDFKSGSQSSVMWYFCPAYLDPIKENFFSLD